MSIVKHNLMNTEGYTPYCGGSKCTIMPRTLWNGNQFECDCCGWETSLDEEFIEEYKKKWGIKDKPACEECGDSTEEALYHNEDGKLLCTDCMFEESCKG